MQALDSFTLNATIFPTVPGGRRQAIMGCWSAPEKAGWALVLDCDGSAMLLLNDICIATGVPLMARRWAMIAATFDSEKRTVTVVQQEMDTGVSGAYRSQPRIIEQCVSDATTAQDIPFLIAAWNNGDDDGRARAGGFFNGKIDAPRLLTKALPVSSLPNLRHQALPAGLAEHALGWWDFSKSIDSDQVIDASDNAMNGATHQMPTRGVTGFNRTGEEHSWVRAPDQYGAIHFHDDDIVDAEWSIDFRFLVPDTMASGVYAARIRQGDQDSENHIVFFVRPARGQKTANLVFLMPSATYLATFDLLEAREPNNVYLKEHREVGSSLYDRHSDWSGIHYSSRRRPLLTMSPRQNQIWGFPADANILAWLDHAGIAYDVITDEDLHREGQAILTPYRSVMTGSHPEYYSTRMRDGLDGYLSDGGRLMYLGANGIYWRIAFHPADPGIIEIRRAEDGTRSWIAQPGEYYQSFNGEYGGLWRRIGPSAEPYCRHWLCGSRVGLGW